MLSFENIEGLCLEKQKKQEIIAKNFKSEWQVLLVEGNSYFCLNLLQNFWLLFHYTLTYVSVFNWLTLEWVREKIEVSK
jgi:hypothetical protein